MKKIQKRLLIITSIFIFAFLIHKTVYALYQADYSLTNDFTVSNVNVDIEETLNRSTWPSSTTNEVTVVNKENSPAIVRVMYTEIWKYNNTILITK